MNKTKVETKVETKLKMYDYLESAGTVKILWLLLKTLSKNKFRIEPIFLDKDESGTEIGLIAPIDLSNFKQKQTTKAF